MKGLLEGGSHKRDYAIFRPRLLSLGNWTFNNLPLLNKVSLDTQKKKKEKKRQEKKIVKFYL